MAYNYSKLLGRIIEKYKTQARFAEVFELSERSLSLKLTNKVGWKQQEITRASELLDIADSEIHDYFFTLEVQRN